MRISSSGSREPTWRSCGKSQAKPTATVSVAAPLASLYDVPELRGLLALIAFGGLTGAFTSTAVYTLAREQRLGRLNLFEVATQLLA